MKKPGWKSGFAVAASLALSSVASGAVDWSTAGKGDWKNGANWTGGVPGASDEVRIDNGGVAEVGRPVRAKSATLGYGSGNSGSLAVSADLSLAKAIVVGRGGRGRLAVSGGATVFAGECVHIGFLENSEGTVELRGRGSRLHSGGALYVGRDGAATLVVGKGAAVHVDGTLKINGGGTAAECAIKLRPGSMLALGCGDLKGRSLARFLDLVQGTGNIQYWDGNGWASITSGREGVDYRIDTFSKEGKTYARLLLLEPSPLRLASIFSDNMVLQQQCDVAIWGWANPGEQITVRADWSGEPVSAVAGSDGKWSATIPTPAASARPYALVVADGSGHTVKLSNVLIGEVWFCSGQSNMWWPVGKSTGSGEALASINTDIRLFTVGKHIAAEPVDDCVGTWQVAGIDSIPGFSAVAFYFGRELADRLGVPVGLIHSSWRGTSAEPWTPRAAIQAESRLSEVFTRDFGKPKHMPGGLFNGMVHPLVRFPIRGVVWYQGESNRQRAFEYKTLFPLLIKSWREAWKQPGMPFYFVQIAPLAIGKEKHPRPAEIPELQEAQLHALETVPHTGMVVTMDIGDLKSIHPKNKFDVGIRLAAWALAKTYGWDLACSGPVYREMAVEGSNARIFFSHAEGGLESGDGQPLREFTIAGPNGRFHPATARIDGDTVVVSSDQVERPVAVRYCWRNEAQGNLFNQKANLPASPFKTDGD